LARAEQRLEPPRVEHLGLRQEIEDPAAVVVDHHERAVVRPMAEGREQGGGVVQERQVPD
jgi:hypothetical protein